MRPRLTDYSIMRQFIRRFIKLTDCWHIPYSSAITRPVRLSTNIFSTFSGVNLDQGARDPRTSRLFASISAVLSRIVPRNKWSGLTHAGMSHLWQTTNPNGISPLCSIHENRCALCSFFLDMRKRPWPKSDFAPSHSQQVSVFSTLAQKLLTLPPYLRMSILL